MFVNQEHDRLRHLLRHHQQGLLTPLEQMELRGLLARRSPRAVTMPLDDLIELGLFALGLSTIVRAVRT